MFSTLLLGLALQSPAPCIPGSEIQYFPAGSDGRTFGQEYIAYDPASDHVALAKAAKADEQMYLYAAGMWIYGDDWCFDADANTVRFLRSPLRVYAFGGGPGEEIGAGTVVWLGYNTPEG